MPAPAVMEEPAMTMETPSAVPVPQDGVEALATQVNALVTHFSFDTVMYSNPLPVIFSLLNHYQSSS